MSPSRRECEKCGLKLTIVNPPAIIFLGTQDKLIPVAVVERFNANLTKAGVRCEAIFYEGQGHGFFNPRKVGNDPFYHETPARDR